MTRLHPGREPLTEAELEGLDRLFCVLIAGPDTVMPSEYLPVVSN